MFQPKTQDHKQIQRETGTHSRLNGNFIEEERSLQQHNMGVSKESTNRHSDAQGEVNKEETERKFKGIETVGRVKY